MTKEEMLKRIEELERQIKDLERHIDELENRGVDAISPGAAPLRTRIVTGPR